MWRAHLGLSAAYPSSARGYAQRLRKTLRSAARKVLICKDVLLLRKRLSNRRASQTLLTRATLKYRLFFGFRLSTAGPSGVNSPPRPSQDVGDE